MYNLNCNKYKWIDNNILFDKNIPYRNSMSAMYHKCKIKQCYIHKLYYMHIDYRKCNLKQYCNHIDHHKYMKIQCYNHTNNHNSNKFYVPHKNIHTYKYSLNYSPSRIVYHKYIHVQKCTKYYTSSY